jgi:NADH:ubiquinone oxidoreductase subunit 6 (subunit J)
MIAFELAAVVLTVALVAAVYVARRRKVDLQEEGAEG